MALWRKSRKIDHTEAEAALTRAEVAKKRVAARGPEVSAVSSALRRMREENHLRERMLASFRV
jgi:hypothetical protein